MLSNAEIANIERGLFDIHSIGQDMVVPFHANKLRNASVVWINERWFLEKQINITDSHVRARLERWLIEEYAFVVPLESDSTADFGDYSKTFFADSYGSSAMATHGGSGRVGISGRFQVKGIGKTPLVGVAADWLHSHGCLWLEEALREAIYSEIAAAEFPHGAVPILAVIDTGLHLRLENGEWGDRRALTIRPVVVRPAYFERAILFQPPGQEHVARKRDVRRVKQVVRYFENRIQQPTDLTFTEWIDLSFTRTAQQIAFSRAHRLFPGNYASSNLSMDGELLDFGPFRALPNWCRSISMNDVEGFGNEVVEITDVIKSISFYVNKYRSVESAGLNPSELLLSFSRELEQDFARNLLYIFHLDEVDDADIRENALAVLFDYYRMQQRIEVRFQNGCVQKLDWLGDIFSADKAVNHSNSFEDVVLAKLDSIIATSQLERRGKAVVRRRMRMAAARLLPTRREILRESLVKSLNSIILERYSGSCHEKSLLADAVNGFVCRNRRHWPFVPRNLVVIAQFSSARCSILYCNNPENGRYFLWIEAISLDNNVWCFDKWVARSVVDSYTYKTNRSWWFGLFPASPLSPETTVAELDLLLPDNAIWFNSNECATLQKSFESSKD